MFPRWKHFCWRILHRVVPTRQNLGKTGVVLDQDCPICNLHPESQDHLFRKCHVTQRVWGCSSFGIASAMPDNISVDAWLINFLNLFFNQDGDDQGRVIEFMAIIWAIWLHRNEIIFRNMRVSVEVILNLAQAHVQRWYRAQEVREIRNVKQGSIEDTPGIPSPQIFRMGKCTSREFISIVVDAAWKPRGKVGSRQWTAAVGWTEETSQQHRIKGARRIFAQDPLQAECYAIWWGVSQAVGHSMNVIIKTDCLQAVSALSEPSMSPTNVVDIVEDILLMISSFSYFVCVKVGRDQVSKPHFLAQQERKGC